MTDKENTDGASGALDGAGQKPQFPFFSKKHYKLAKEPIWANNPIFCQILGICSALAVTNRLDSAIVMSVALTFVLCCSNVILSCMREFIPNRIRMIVEVAVIATFVIFIDQLLKAFWFDMSKTLGPYTGLIITNCIVMGRAEAYALQNPPAPSFWDGLGNGLGYSFVLCAIAVPREILGSGALLGFRVLPQGYPECQLMILAPGAFIMLGVLLWVLRAISPVQEKK
ncbi:MAG: NADH:ubiquinone reductase (Na(+)-transporting) subunit D [Planctomycetes bacterium]|nr:NADH:ubiquinone reductase (Na(+)-transporting) subunit D [Planctomycetota bacterium]